jgi:esterase/lipase superfamily enzyme
MKNTAEVYAVTNRRLNLEPDGWEDHFTNDFSLEHDLRFANYWQNEEGEIEGIVYEDGSSANIYKDIQARMRDEKKDCLIFGHGFNNSYQDAIKAAIKLSIAFNVIVIVFTWPSDGLFSYHNVKKYRAFATVPAWDRFIEKYTDNLRNTKPEDFCGQRVSLVAHRS